VQGFVQMFAAWS